MGLIDWADGYRYSDGGTDDEAGWSAERPPSWAELAEAAGTDDDEDLEE